MERCVVIADAGRARFFTVTEPEDDRFEGGPDLLQQDEWTNPEGQLTGQELFDNLKSGRKRATSGPQAHGQGAPAHGLNDHREQHEREIERRFARDLARATAELVRERGASRLVLVADPRLLGLLRDSLGKALSSLSIQVTVDELAEDLSGHPIAHIAKVLRHHGVLPPRQEPPLAYRPRAQPPPAGSSGGGSTSR